MNKQNALQTLGFAAILSFFTFFILADHLSSKTLSGVSSPAHAANACAPCGAPCKE